MGDQGEPDATARVAQLRMRLDAVQRIAGLGTWELDLASGALRTSSRLDELLGRTPTSFDDLLDAVHPADRDRVADAHAAAVRDRTGYDVEHRIMRDGTVVRLRQHAVALSSTDGGLVVGTVQDVTAEVARARRLLDVESRRRELLHRLVRASEEARSQLAGDLHDGPVQILTATAMRLEVLARTDPDPPPWLAESLPVVRGVCTQLRDVLFDLHPQAVGAGVADTIAHLAGTVLPGTPVTVEVRGDEPPPRAARAVHGLVQEAFWDVREHDTAESVAVELAVGEHAEVVLDGGAGSGPLLTRSGLFAVRERCEAAGGTATLERDDRVLRCAVPLGTEVAG